MTLNVTVINYLKVQKCCRFIGCGEYFKIIFVRNTSTERKIIDKMNYVKNDIHELHCKLVGNIVRIILCLHKSLV